MGGVLAAAPPDAVDLLLNLERLEVVELGLVRLELGEELVLASLLALVALKQHHAPAAISRRQVVARRVKLDRRDDVRCVTRKYRPSRRPRRPCRRSTAQTSSRGRGP